MPGHHGARSPALRWQLLSLGTARTCGNASEVSLPVYHLAYTLMCASGVIPSPTASPSLHDRCLDAKTVGCSWVQHRRPRSGPTAQHEDTTQRICAVRVWAPYRGLATRYAVRQCGRSLLPRCAHMLCSAKAGKSSTCQHDVTF